MNIEEIKKQLRNKYWQIKEVLEYFIERDETERPNYSYWCGMKAGIEDSLSVIMGSEELADKYLNHNCKAKQDYEEYRSDLWRGIYE